MRDQPVRRAKERVKAIEKIIAKYGATPSLEAELAKARGDIGVAELEMYDRRTARGRAKILAQQSKQPELPLDQRADAAA